MCNMWSGAESTRRLRLIVDFVVTGNCAVVVTAFVAILSAVMDRVTCRVGSVVSLSTLGAGVCTLGIAVGCFVLPVSSLLAESIWVMRCMSRRS